MVRHERTPISADLLRMIFAQSLDGIEIYDAGGKLVDVNPTCLEMFGVDSVDDIRGFDLFGDPHVPPEVCSCLERGEPVRYETVFDFELIRRKALYPTTRSGQCFIHYLIVPFRGPDNSITGYLVHVHDITERKRAEAVLHESEERYRQLVDETDTGFLVTNDKRVVLEANAPYMRLIGAEKMEEVIGHSVLEWTAPEARDSDAAAITMCFRQGFIKEFETIYLHRDGTRVHIGINATMREAEGGKRLVCFCRDISERKRIEAQIIRLGDLKEGLIATQSLNDKLKGITDGIVEILGADFARIWLMRESDLCDTGCIHAGVKEGPHVCRNRARCLHLVASSGRYTHIDGNHRRVPFGCYKIGRVAAGEDSRFITNDVVHDPRVHDHEWAQTLGLVSFAGFRLLSGEAVPIGVMALFSKQAITPTEEGLLTGLANYSSQVILSDRVREALLESEAKFRTLFENANDAIFVMKDDVFIDCNVMTFRVFQCSREQMIGQTPYRFSPPLQPDGRESKEKALEKIHAALAGNPQVFEWKHCRYDGTPFDAEVSLNAVELGREVAVQAIVRDVTERMLLEQELRTLSMVDGLTGLSNRRGFLMLAEQQLRFAERTKKRIVLFYVDLDRLKWVNDTLGHGEGDAALVETAAILRRTFRKSDIIGRMGGDEFAILAMDTACGAREAVTRLRESIESYNKSETRGYTLALSVGIAHFDPEKASAIDELIAKADNLMYEEKRDKLPVQRENPMDGI